MTQTSDIDIQQVVLVTGPAGAGRTTAIRALEDIGFEAIDNLPLGLMPRLLDGPPVGPMVIGADPRTRDFGADRMGALVERFAGDPRFALTLLYVDCEPGVLIRRYNETRRRHPSSPDGQPLEGIEREIAMLAPLRRRADVLIDTTSLGPHQLKAEVQALFQREAGAALAITLHSFSYKRGTPRGVDMVIDCRFLANPHWEERLRPMDGRDAEVAAFVAADPLWSPFIGRLEDLLRFLLPAYRAEGKSYFNFGLGCTGGRHRSVAAVEALAKSLAADGWQVSSRHRDLVARKGGGDALLQGAGVA